MEIPSLHKLKSRFLETFLTAPKIFLGAFLWEGFALGCKCSEYSLSFYWLSGLGCAIGTHLGHVLVTFALRRGDFSYWKEFTTGLLYGMCVLFGTGTAWQRVVNDGHDWKFTFTGAFFYMWLIAFVLFLTALTFFRKMIEIYAEKSQQKHHFDHLKSTFYFDFLLSVSVGLGDAFFMGTAATEQFEDNWLSGTFGVYENTPTGTAMAKSGFSTVCGFLICQAAQNLVLKHCWTDTNALDDQATSLLEVSNNTLHEEKKRVSSSDEKETFTKEVELRSDAV